MRLSEVGLQLESPPEQGLGPARVIQSGARGAHDDHGNGRCRSKLESSLAPAQRLVHPPEEEESRRGIAHGRVIIGGELHGSEIRLERLAIDAFGLISQAAGLVSLRKS